MRSRSFTMMAAVVIALTGCPSDDDSTGGPTNGDGLRDTQREIEREELGSEDLPQGDQPSDSIDDIESDDLVDMDEASDVSGDSDALGCESGILCGAPAECCLSEEECVFGNCVPICDSGIRCGEAANLCCEDEQVCVAGACETPGDSCTDSFECPVDSFCEPTLGQCLPQLDPVACEIRPESPSFEPVVEWHWEGMSADPTWNQVLSVPVVADIDADGVPEVAFSTYDDSWHAGVTAARLVVVDGQTGDEEVTVTDASRHLASLAHLAVGQLDDDPELEIVGVGYNDDGGGLIALEHDGAFKWRQVEVYHSRGAPAIADIDGDGAAEVVFGGAVVAGVDGEVIADYGSIGTNRFAVVYPPISAVADIDGDSIPDLVGGGVAIRTDGSEIFRLPDGIDGFPAVADFFDNELPDIVSVYLGEARILTWGGDVIFGPLALPGGGDGGAPTVADFDGDGAPEFATAGLGKYTVFDPECTAGSTPDVCPTGRPDGILWSVDVQDISSNTTGSSVFDFEGDGRAEVVYNDECFLRVFDGSTGDILLERANSSRTGTEYPVIVDVDADNHAEIVVIATDDAVERDGCEVGTHGVFALGDANNQWVRTRQIWNQHAYHVTNVNADGTIPTEPLNHWEEPGLNAFRQNILGEGVFNAPNLQMLSLDASMTDCPDGVTLRAWMFNAGSLGVPAGVRVAFFEGTPEEPGTLLGVGVSAEPLLPGATTLVELLVVLTGEPPFDFFAIADDNGDGVSAVEECIEDDNTAAIEEVECKG